MELRFLRFITALSILLFSGAAYISAYAPIDSDTSLFYRDIPVFDGNDITRKRIEDTATDHPVWALNLSGGSARAFAHIGVIKRLEEEGLRPDVIITNSMGSIVGLAYAAGMSIEDIEDLIKTISISEFFDLSLPLKGGIIDVRRFKSFIKYIFNDIDISRTPIPVYVVTEDLKSKRQIILSKGNITDIMTASFALPVYFNPVDFEGFKLIDGGTSNLVPIDPFTEFIPNMVVSSTFYDAEVNLENPVTILNVTMDISKTRRAVNQIKRHNPFLIRCDVEKISYMAFDDGENIIQKGYDSCSRAMPALLSYLEERNIYPSGSPLKKFSVAEKLHDNWTSVKNRIDYISLPYDGKGRSSNIGLVTRKKYDGEHYLKQNMRILQNNFFWNSHVLASAGISVDFNGVPGMDSSLEINAANSFFANLKSSITFPDPPEGIPEPGEGYIFSSFKYIHELAGGILHPVLYFEDVTDFHLGTNRFLLRPEINYDIALPFPTSSRDAVFKETAGYYYSEETFQDTGTGIMLKNRVSIPVGELVTLRNRQLYKISLGTNRESAELSYNDFLRSSSSTAFSERNRYFSSYLILNNSISWQIGSMFPTVGEMFILDKSELYIYGDFLITDEISPSVGIGFRLTTSLIGLKPWSMDFILGRDTRDGDYFFSFNLE